MAFEVPLLQQFPYAAHRRILKSLVECSRWQSGVAVVGLVRRSAT